MAIPNENRPKVLQLGADRFAEVCIVEINRKFSDMANTVAGGGCPDHNSYKAMTGRLSGYKDAMDTIRECLARVNAPDSDPGGEGLEEMT